MDGVLQAVELDVEGKGGVVARRAGVNDGAAAEVHDQQQLVLWQDAQFARGDADVTLQRRPDLTDDGRIRRILDVEDQHARMRMWAVCARSARIADPTGARSIGAVADIDEVVEDRQSGIHAAIEKWILSNKHKVRRRAGRATSGSDTNVGVCSPWNSEDKGDQH